MKKILTAKLAVIKKFVTGESRYCQNCGKESDTLFEIVPEGAIKNKLQYCKECVDNK